MASRSNAPPRSNPSDQRSNVAGENTAGAGTSATRPEPTALQPPKKKRNHRGGKKKRARKQSFAASTEDGSGMPGQTQREREESSHNIARETFYRLQAGRNNSNTSLESEALLDHRYVHINSRLKGFTDYFTEINLVCDLEELLRWHQIADLMVHPHIALHTRINSFPLRMRQSAEAILLKKSPQKMMW